MINVLVIVMEGIAAWLCLHCAFGEKIKKSKGEIIFFLFYISLFALCSFGILSRLFYILFWIFAFIWCKVMFGRKKLSTIVRTAIGIVAVGVIETVSIYIYSLFYQNNKITTILECFVAGGIMLMLSILSYFVIVKRGTRYLGIRHEPTILLLLFIILMFLFYVKIEFELYRTVPVIYVYFFVVLSIAFVYLCIKQKKLYELEKKSLNMELQNIYGKAYEELLKEVRRRQHDYKNQLMAIHSMHTTANSLDELKSMQENYISIVEEESEFDCILTMCNNPILAGYLYSMSIKCKEKNIKLKSDVKIENRDIDIKTKDIIELLGILIINALEYLEENTELERTIVLGLYQKIDRMLIEVRNSINRISYDDVSEMFSDGASTKARDRGLGLFVAKKIVQKYEGNIYVNIKNIENERWIAFEILM